tara:strand:+ start:1439 stop:1639 length:201 start_codon:yes stop_codon:yes gene_type:complete
MWEVWQWNGQYIKGKRIKRSKTKETAVKHAKKIIKYKKMVKGDNKNEFYLEDEDGRPIGIIINKEK